MYSKKMYPPRFTLQVHSKNATHDAVALVEFLGACQDMSTEIYLGLPTAGTKKYAVFSFIICSCYIELYPICYLIVVTSVFWLCEIVFQLLHSFKRYLGTLCLHIIQLFMIAISMVVISCFGSILLLFVHQVMTV